MTLASKLPSVLMSILLACELQGVALLYILSEWVQTTLDRSYAICVFNTRNYVYIHEMFLEGWAGRRGLGGGAVPAGYMEEW